MLKGWCKAENRDYVGYYFHSVTQKLKTIELSKGNRAFMVNDSSGELMTEMGCYTNGLIHSLHPIFISEEKARQSLTYNI